MVHRAEKGYREDIFIQDNYYYLCDVSSETVKQRLDPYEAQEQFTVEWIDPKEAIRQNRSDDHNGIEQIDHPCKDHLTASHRRCGTIFVRYCLKSNEKQMK